jgi:hypothetical protein
MNDPLVYIKAPKCLLVYPASVLSRILHSDPDAWADAVRRGKAIKRRQAIIKRVAGYGKTT